MDGTLPGLADGSLRNAPEDRNGQGPRLEQSSSVSADIEEPSLHCGSAEGLAIEKGVGQKSELLLSKSSSSESTLDAATQLQEPASLCGLAESSGNEDGLDPKNELLTCELSLSDAQLQEPTCGLSDHEGLIDGDGQDPKAEPSMVAHERSLSEPIGGTQLLENPSPSCFARHKAVGNGDGQDRISENFTQTLSTLVSELAANADSQEPASSGLADEFIAHNQEAERIIGNQTPAVDEEDTTVVVEGYSIDDVSGLKPLAGINDVISSELEQKSFHFLAKMFPATTNDSNIMINPVSPVANEFEAESISEARQKSPNVRWCWSNVR